MALQGAPRHIAVCGETVFVLQEDWQLASIAIARPALAVIGAIARFMHDGDAPAKSFAVLPEAARFVASSLFDDAFHIFRTDAGLTHVASLRQRFSLLATVSAAGGPLLLTAWRDSSITLWNVVEAAAVYRIMPHFTTVVDVDVDPELRLIASLDESRNCVLSTLTTGRFVRSFRIDGDERVEKITLFTSGFVAVAAVGEGPGVKTVLSVHGIDGKKTAQVAFEDEIGAWAKGEFESGLGCLAVGFRGRALMVMRVPDLALLTERTTAAPIVAVDFSVSLGAFVIADTTGRIAIAMFGRKVDCYGQTDR
jgi:hypothetical protein